MSIMSAKIILFGFGTIGKCFLPLLLKEGFDPASICVIDQVPLSDEFSFFQDKGVRYFQHRIEPENVGQIFSSYMKPGDILVNLSVSVDCLAVASWCQSHGILYIDTVFEPWGEDIFGLARPPQERTMYWEHQNARNYALEHWQKGGPTALFGHGANPGLVTHFAKAALMDFAASLSSTHFDAPHSQEEWAILAEELGIRVIHIAERDTQISNRPKQVNEFVNSWSAYAFIEEASRPVEMGWGTHESTRPRGAHEHHYGPKNALYVPIPASQFLVKSWIPSCGQIEGLALPHSESITLSEYFSYRRINGAFYRPTVIYSYLPTDFALASLHEIRMNNWVMPLDFHYRIMSQDITQGADELGVMLLGERGGWWYGSRLSIAKARKHVPFSNATALQVAAGVLSAMIWMKNNSNLGYCECEKLPHQEILKHASPYLGDILSLPTEWNPLQNPSGFYEEPNIDPTDPWQFNNFIHSFFRGDMNDPQTKSSNRDHWQRRIPSPR